MSRPRCNRSCSCCGSSCSSTAAESDDWCAGYLLNESMAATSALALWLRLNRRQITEDQPKFSLGIVLKEADGGGPFGSVAGQSDDSSGAILRMLDGHAVTKNVRRYPRLLP